MITRMNACALSLALAAYAAGCGAIDDGSSAQAPVTADKPFAEGGRVTVKIDRGDCQVRLAPSPSIHTELSGNIGQARAAISVDGAQANVAVEDAPGTNFHCIVDVPKSDELRVALGGGNLKVGAIAVHTTVESGAGNTEIAVTDTGDYQSVEAALAAGDLDGGPFGEHHSGITPRMSWTGSGTRTLVARSGAGNIVLRR